jgi:hypothetical protein
MAVPLLPNTEQTSCLCLLSSPRMTFQQFSWTGPRKSQTTESSKDDRPDKMIQ